MAEQSKPNTFGGGMVTDLDPGYQPKDTYFTGLNVRVITNGDKSFSLETIQGRLANNEAILLDVREQDEWNLGHLKAAVLAPLSVLEEGAGDEGFDALLGKLSKDKIIYCHCVSGGRVMPASKILHQQGYDVRPLKPGYDDLVEAGFEDVE